MSYSFQWEKRDASGANPVDIDGATGPTFTIPSDGSFDGATVGLRVSSAGVSVEAPPTGVISPAPPAGDPNLYGPWLLSTSPWRTRVDSIDWEASLHPDYVAMMQQRYLGNDFTPLPSFDVHAFGYDQTDMTTKWGSSGPTFMKWCGPGPFENVVYAKSTDTFITVYVDFPTYKAYSIQIPLPLDWNGYREKNPTAYYERRTIIVCDDGRSWILYQPSPPGDVTKGGHAADGFWHATVACATASWKTDINFPFGPEQSGGYGGGSGIGHGAGLLLPSDIAYARVHGDFGHALAFDANSAADGSYTTPHPHPSGVWPALKGPGLVAGGNGDGKTKTVVGHPHAARVFIFPTHTDSDFEAAGLPHKSPDDWTYWFARNHQRYGLMSKESSTGQGSAGGIMSESQESIAWNAAHGVPGYVGYIDPWVKDGTTDNEVDGSLYNAALVPGMLPGVGNPGSINWGLIDWELDIPGITVPA